MFLQIVKKGILSTSNLRIAIQDWYQDVKDDPRVVKIQKFIWPINP